MSNDIKLNKMTWSVFGSLCSAFGLERDELYVWSRPPCEDQSVDGVDNQTVTDMRWHSTKL